MVLEENISLKNLHTLGFEVQSRFGAKLHSEQDAIALFKKFQEKYPILPLGGGSNVFFSKDFQGIVASVLLKGSKIVHETEAEILWKVKAGENWHETVLYAVQHQWAGLENLSLIPGTVGAAPIQNIGAYGVELKDVVDSVSVIDRLSLEHRVLTKEECEFGYRDSIFKGKDKNRYFITAVTFRLSKKPCFQLSYGGLHSFLEGKEISLQSISDAVCAIRSSKLPDPKVIGNAGSFFKNPEISENQHTLLKIKHPKLVSFPVKNGFKLSAGWLIEACGWKGYRENHVGCYENQALVLVHFGNGRPQELSNLAATIKKSVYDTFEIVLEQEVNAL